MDDHQVPSDEDILNLTMSHQEDISMERSPGFDNDNLSIEFESDTDFDDELYVIDSEHDEDGAISSDTSDEDGWYRNFSPVSSDSSLADSFMGEEDEGGGFFELMNQHLDIFNHEADSFFRVSLRTLYETLMEFMEEKTGPTPQHVIQSLPTVKVTLAQIASNTTCPICFAEYEQEEKLTKLPCNHLYHTHCIVSWLKLWKAYCQINLFDDECVIRAIEHIRLCSCSKKSTCPTCRMDVAKTSSSNRSRDEIENIENVDMTTIDSVLIDSNDIERTQLETIDETDENPTTTSSINIVQSQTTNSLLSTSRLGSQESFDLVQSTASTSSYENIDHVQTRRVFSRSSSPINVDSSEDTDSTNSPFSSKVSIVEAVGAHASNVQNKRYSLRSSSATNDAPAAKRKSRETEIW